MIHLATRVALICWSNTEHSSLLDADGRKISNNAREIQVFNDHLCLLMGRKRLVCWRMREYFLIC